VRSVEGADGSALGPGIPLLFSSLLVTLFAGATIIAFAHFFPAGQMAGRLIGAILLVLAALDVVELVRLPWSVRRSAARPLTITELENLRSRDRGRVYMGDGFAWSPDVVRRYYLFGQAQDVSPSSLARSRPVLLPHSAFSQHMITFGTTQSGKSTLNELLSVQAILDGDPVIVINPKEGGRWLNWAYAASLHAKRADRFHLVSLSYPNACSTYSPLQDYSDATELADRIVIPLPESRDAAPYKAFCHKVMYVVSEAMIACGIAPTFERLLKYSLENMGELLQKLLVQRFPHAFRPEQLRTPDQLKGAIQDYRDRVSRGLIEEDRTVNRLATLYSHPIDNFQRMVNSLVPYLVKLSTGAAGTVMNVEKGDVRWHDVVEGRGVVYFDLAGMKGALSSEAVARMIVSDLTSFVGTRYAYFSSRPRIHLFVDEFSNVLTREFLDVLNKAAGSGLRVYAMAQSMADPEAVLGSRAQAQRMLDNMRLKAQMQAADETGAAGFSEICGKTKVHEIELSMNTRPAFFSAGHRAVADYEQSQSRKQAVRSEFLVPPELLQRMERGQMFFKLGGELHFVQVRPLEEPGVDYLSDVRRVVRI